MSDIITTLHPENDDNENLYPNIKKENIPSKSIDRTKLDDNVNEILDGIDDRLSNAIASITQPKYYSTLPTTDVGLIVYSDGYIYSWDGTQYVTTGIVYQSTQIANNSIDDVKIKNGSVSTLKTKFINVLSRNLINPNECSNNQYCKEIIVTSPYYFLTNFIEVESGSIYETFMVNDTSVRRFFKYITFYDENYNYVSWYENTNNDVSITIPSNVKYARITYANLSDYISDFYSVAQDTTFYKRTASSEEIFYDKYVDDISTLKKDQININDVTGYKKCGKNLFDVNNVIDNKVIEVLYFNYLKYTTTSSYKTSNRIKLKANTNYVINKQFRKLALLYPNTNMCISHIDILTAAGYTFTTTIECDLIFSFYSNETDIQVEEGTTPSSYESYKEYFNGNILLNETQLAQIDIHSILTNKKWYACGDSFTEQGYNSSDPGYGTDSILPDGIYAGYNAVYPYYIGNRTACDVHNVALGGMSLATYTGGTNCFTYNNQYQTLIGADADYITLYFGINDSHQNIPIGTINDNTTDTFYGALNVVISWILENRPNAKLGVIISNGCDTTEYPTATINACKKWGVPYLDINGDETLPMVIRTNMRTNLSQEAYNLWLAKYRVSATNLHPNYKAHEDESYMIQQFLERL